MMNTVNTNSLELNFSLPYDLFYYTFGVIFLAVIWSLSDPFDREFPLD